MSDEFSRMFAAYPHDLRWDEFPPESIHEAKLGIDLVSKIENQPDLEELMEAIRI